MVLPWREETKVETHLQGHLSFLPAAASSADVTTPTAMGMHGIFGNLSPLKGHCFACGVIMGWDLLQCGNIVVFLFCSVSKVFVVNTYSACLFVTTTKYIIKSYNSCK
jgi:hypothetical protein